jgi:hypothetical protein
MSPPPTTDGAAFRRTMPCCGSDFGDGDYNDLRARVAELEGSNEANVAMIAKQRAMLLDAQAREKGLREAVRAYVEWYETDPSLIHNTNARVLVEIITPKLKAAIAERPAPPEEVRSCTCESGKSDEASCPVHRDPNL